jgi:DNA polymerase III epsilon subunit-like protein
MTEFYFDIETTGLDPKLDKIITIQFQKLDTKTGKPLGELYIIKEWESSEEHIVKTFFNVFNRPKWGFIPIGMNLLFDLNFIRCKAEKYLNLQLDPVTFFHNRPYLDIKPILVILNEGNFVGCSLDKFTGKNHGGALVPVWYNNKEYEKIINYVKQEAEEFVKFYQFLKESIPKIMKK